MIRVSGRYLLGGLLLALAIVCIARAAGAQESMQLMIISPSNGEIFYASKLGYIVAIPITGRVTVPEGSSEVVDVQLTIHSPHKAPLTLTTHPDDDGFFVFHLDLNPDNIPLPSIGERYFYYSENCPDCHFSSGIALPLGELLLEISATNPAGHKISAERRVTVDRSQLATLPIQVVLEGGPDYALDGIPVQAETWLYEWRGRLFRELTNDDGWVDLRVEALSQRDTHYLLSVLPTLIGNRRYQSAEPVKVIVPPGTELLDPVVLTVVVENGSINGRVESAMDLSSIDANASVLSIAQPSGLVYHKLLQKDNTFSFDGLPLSKYILTVNTANIKEWTAQPVQLDLVEEATAEVSISLVEKPGSELRGRLVDETGRPIPFGWLAETGGSYVGQVLPLDGRFKLTDPDNGQEPIQVTAPGYWSQSVVLDAGEEQEIVMQPRPDRRTISWGNGQLYLPAKSVILDPDDTLSLVRGWIWGYNDQPDPFVINLEGAELEMQAANFALEYAPGEVSWLYVNDGQAYFTSREGISWQITAGEMMAFGDGVPVPNPVAADELVINLFREERKPTSVLLYEPEPTPAQRLGYNIAEFGRNLSQVIVAGTYLLMFLAIVGAILFGIRRLLQVRR